MVSGRVLYDKLLDADARVKLLSVLSVAALKDDVILLLHQDRREHIIMNYAFDIDRHSPEEQLPLAQFVSKNFSRTRVCGKKHSNNGRLCSLWWTAGEHVRESQQLGMVALHIRVATPESEHQQYKGDD